MLKIILYLILLVISVSAEDKNIGFMMNQKYVCINQGALVDDKIVPIFSKEDAIKYPMRIMVDSKNILHTDGKQDLKLPFIDSKIYGNQNNQIILGIEDNRRVAVYISKTMQNTPVLYFCVETDNWTIAQ